MRIRLFTQTLNPKVESTVKWNIRDRYFSAFERSQLQNKDFTIFCNNCLGAGIYHRFGLQYTSPTVGLFFTSSDYLRFLENLDYYLEQPLRFVKSSTHSEVNRFRSIVGPYPIGLLDDIELQFLHYDSQEEANAKWSRRVKRVNRDNLFVVFCDIAPAGSVDDEFLQCFELLPYEYKVFFSAIGRASKSVVTVPADEGEDYELSMVLNRKYEKYFDVRSWLNKPLKKANDLLQPLLSE